MPDLIPNFGNVILCEDIRDETGNKKSLMGVLSGDILVSSLPATIQLAIYAELTLSKNQRETDEVKFRLLQDDEEIALISVEVTRSANHRIAAIVLPKANVAFERPCDFVVRASVNNRPEVEIIRKRLAPTS